MEDKPNYNSIERPVFVQMKPTTIKLIHEAQLHILLYTSKPHKIPKWNLEISSSKIRDDVCFQII